MLSMRPSTCVLYSIPIPPKSEIHRVCTELARQAMPSISVCDVYLGIQFIHESGTYFFNPSNTMKMNAELGADRKHVMPHPL